MFLHFYYLYQLEPSLQYSELSNWAKKDCPVTALADRIMRILRFTSIVWFADRFKVTYDRIDRENLAHS